jgi:hypothetical protein
MKQTFLAVLAISTLALCASAQAAAAKPQTKAAYQAVDVYPTTTCVVSGKTLDPKATTTVQAGGLTFKVCSAECAKKVTAAPEEFGKKLEAATIAAQAPFYALTTCPISNEKLEDGKAKNAVLDGTLVQFCCARCVAKAADKKAEVLAKSAMRPTRRRSRPTRSTSAPSAATRSRRATRSTSSPARG